MQIGYLYGLGATPGSYECLAFPSTPGCKPVIPTTPSIPAPTTPVVVPATPTIPAVPQVTAGVASFWNKIPTWAKVIGGLAIAYFGYKTFVAKK